MRMYFGAGGKCYRPVFESESTNGVHLLLPPSHTLTHMGLSGMHTFGLLKIGIRPYPDFYTWDIMFPNGNERFNPTGTCCHSQSDCMAFSHRDLNWKTLKSKCSIFLILFVYIITSAKEVRPKSVGWFVDYMAVRNSGPCQDLCTSLMGYWHRCVHK